MYPLKRGLGHSIIEEETTTSKTKTNNPTYDLLKSAFPDSLQGSKGFLFKTSDSYDTKRFHPDVLVSSDGTSFVVSNQ